MRKIVMVGICAFAVLSCSGKDIMPFDAETWRDPSSYAYREDDITERQKMLDTVLRLIEDKSRKEVTELLGEDIDTGYFKGEPTVLVYILGPERSFMSIDSEWLVLTFDENDIFLSHQVLTD